MSIVLPDPKGDDQRESAMSTAIDPNMFGKTPPGAPSNLSTKEETTEIKLQDVNTGDIDSALTPMAAADPAVNASGPQPKSASDLNPITENEEIEAHPADLKKNGPIVVGTRERGGSAISRNSSPGGRNSQMGDRFSAAHLDPARASASNVNLDPRRSYSGTRDSAFPVGRQNTHSSREWKKQSLKDPCSLSEVAYRHGIEDPTMRHFQALSTLNVTTLKVNSITWNYEQVSKMEHEEVRLAAVSSDGFIRIYNPKRNRTRPIRELQIDHINEECIEFDSTGTLIATAGSTQDVIIQDLGDISYPITLVGHDSPITKIRFPNKGSLLSASRDSNMILWDTEREADKRTFNSHTAEVCSIDLNPQNHQLFVSGSSDLTVKFWDVRQKDHSSSWRVYENEVTDVQWFQNGQAVMTCSADATCKLLCRRSNKVIQTYEYVGNESFSHLQLSESGRYLFASQHRMLVIFDVLTGKVLDSIQCAAKITELKMSPDYLALACSLSNGTVQFVGLGDMPRQPGLARRVYSNKIYSRQSENKKYQRERTRKEQELQQANEITI